MASSLDSIVLNNGVLMPTIGLGTWKSSPGVVGESVKAAIRCGYRHIDCAAIYGNEAEIGVALKELFDEGAVRREDLFITSKVFNHFHDVRTADQIAAGIKSRPQISLEKTLADLKIDYLDLLLVHWPIAFRLEDPTSLPKVMRNTDGTPVPGLAAEFEFLQTWRAFEELPATGLVRSIGVSNFTIAQLEELLSSARIRPVVNQVELHPLHVQSELRAFCAAHNIVIVGYSGLGSSDSYSGSQPGAPSLLKHEVVTGIATAMGVSPAQVLIRWAIQTGAVTIPKSVNPGRIAENLASRTIAPLSSADIAALDALDRGFRFGMGWMPGHFLPIR
eukprot:c39386_g1_i1.p1 GENE.c39386_g1_i1~~c39386_g1_i1.p1  ORF type:complete len:342 (+),score=56.17 c39386_g1_i1:28-1026(+)